MIKSMTGFGKAEINENNLKITVEISSVNGRFFDLRAKMPRTLKEYEAKLRNIVHSHIERGRVNISIFIDQPGVKASEIAVDYSLTEEYLSIAENISEKYGIENNIDVCTLLSLPDVISFGENGFDGVKTWELIVSAVNNALKAHGDMREKEGIVLEEDIKERLTSINGYIEEIGRFAPEAVKNNTARLRGKIESLIGTDEIDENRFAMEVALYADRVDITEENVRLKSHCKMFSDEISRGKTSGRKLSFLLQEMNREANTIGSKVMDAGISQIVVSIKEELEKMREQTENIE